MPINHQLAKLPIRNTEIKNIAISEKTTITVAGKLMEIRFDELTLVKRLGKLPSRIFFNYLFIY
ncbi:unnamed protein product [Rodentolepis nana]|uniref:Recep_L_domain domain-containing protein n=1 Tax=Rodentolepis nana TaxID=102285 RepID=A0A0R3TX48_RODNA|nr:unnamed protein product [Rodentolepis nana]